MLIVCPSCATSYMIEPASLGPAGRKVRCARCKATWFAGLGKPQRNVSAFVDSVIAEAESQPDAASGDIQASVVKPEAPPPAEPESDVHAEDAPATGDIEAKLPAAEESVSSETPPADTPPADASTPAAGAEQPVTITDAPSLVPPMETPPLPAPVAAGDAEVDSEDIESFAARRERLQTKRRQRQSRSRWTAIILVLVAFNVAIVGARDEVVRYVPQTASLFAKIGLPVNLRHLVFEGVKVSRETNDGATVLLIEGKIVSKSDKPVEVPRLRFSARNDKGQELYTWTALAGRSVLPPGESLDFQSRLASPPKNATDVLVRFFNSRDAIGPGKIDLLAPAGEGDASKKNQSPANSNKNTNAPAQKDPELFAPERRNRFAPKF
ncbi:MAG: MJ0042-type zinc finger domain-containing protein [Pseudolabrys sp.]